MGPVVRQWTIEEKGLEEEKGGRKDPRQGWHGTSRGTGDLEGYKITKDYAAVRKKISNLW